jgi:hypothetical protein
VFAPHQVIINSIRIINAALTFTEREEKKPTITLNWFGFVNIVKPLNR